MKKKKEINWVRWHWLRQHLKQARKSPMPDEPKTNITNFLTTTFSAIPLITAAIYLSGMAYHYGECLVYGLDIVEFPWPADITLSMGYLQLMKAFQCYIHLILSLFFGSLILIIVLFVSVRLRLRYSWFWHGVKSKHFPKMRRHLRVIAHVPAPRLFLALAWLKLIYDRFAILAVPTLIVLLPVLFSFQQGMNFAEKKVSLLENGQLTLEQGYTLSPLLGDTPHIRLMCNTVYCAYRLKGNKVKLVRHEQSELVQWLVPNEP